MSHRGQLGQGAGDSEAGLEGQGCGAWAEQTWGTLGLMGKATGKQISAQHLE